MASLELTWLVSLPSILGSGVLEPSRKNFLLLVVLQPWLVILQSHLLTLISNVPGCSYFFKFAYSVWNAVTPSPHTKFILPWKWTWAIISPRELGTLLNSSYILCTGLFHYRKDYIVLLCILLWLSSCYSTNTTSVIPVSPVLSTCLAPGLLQGRIEEGEQTSHASLKAPGQSKINLKS